MVPNSIIAPSDESGETYAKPDLTQMIPFKPRRFPTPGSHPVAGGEYPMPEGTLFQANDLIIFFHWNAL